VEPGPLRLTGRTTQAASRARVPDARRAIANVEFAQDKLPAAPPGGAQHRRSFRELAAMQIWVDADACPGVIKDILYRAAERARIAVTLVANQPLRAVPSMYVTTIQVGAGFDVADKQIVELVQAGDLVVTADIPLAAAVVKKGALALNPRGELYTAENIGSLLSIRNFLDELRGSGVATGGPATLNARDRQQFANQLDRWLAKRSAAVPPLKS
jgi:uncharacterized protein YaiI (UPF0178 family)